jgi:hydroxypyruvate isomerase
MRRREFLACSAAAVTSACGANFAAAASRRRWRLAPQPGLFETDDVSSTAEQLRFAAEHGFRAFVDAGWLQRTTAEQSKLISIARHFGVAWGPPRGPRLDDSASQEWLGDLDAAFAAAESLDAQAVRVEVFEPPHRGADDIRALLEVGGRIAAQRSLTLLFDPSTAERAAMVVVQERPVGLGLSIDVYQAALQGRDVVDWTERLLPATGHIELADFPGGLEPGTGRLEIARLTALLDERDYAGLVSLRHGRSQPGRKGIHAVLRACRRIEPTIRL